MNNAVELKNISKPDNIVALDTMLGTFTPQPGEAMSVQENYCVLADQERSIFAADGRLYFQWNNRCWNFKDIASTARYAHDFQNKMTLF